MYRGILQKRSADLNNLQKILDPLVIAFIFNNIFFQKFFYLNTGFFFVFLLSMTSLSISGIYSSFRIRKLIDLIPSIISTSSITSLIIPLSKLQNLNFSAYQITNFFISCLIYLIIHHILLRLFFRYLRSKGLNSRNTIFFGNKKSFKLIKNQLEKYPWIGYKIIYWFSPNKIDYKNKGIETDKLSCCGGINDLIETIRRDKIDKLFFYHDEGDDISLNKTLKIFGDFCIPVSYLIDWNIDSMSLRKEFLGDIISLNIWNPEQSILDEKIKKLFDFVFSLLLIILSSPVLFLISILIKFSSDGSILFIQERYGYNGDSFKMYKFRTMYSNTKDQYKNIVQAKRNDPRITKLGKFLRKYSLDELPQLFNVIKGEMSLVGPRPHAVEHNEFYRELITGYMQRHSRLPGMTGLAQVSGARGETSNLEMMEKRIKYDIEYNNNWSLMKDFYILIKTFFSIIAGKAF